MSLDENIKEYGIEIAIEKIAPMIIEKTRKYKETKDEKVKKELLQLLNDREEIYSNNNEVIRKYIGEN